MLPPLLRSQIIGSSDSGTDLTHLDRVARQVLESLIRQSPLADETSRLSLVSTTLTTIARTQQELGLPSDSPAVITDSAGGLVAASWANSVRTGDPGEPSVISCLRIAAHKSGQHQLDDLGYTIHLIGSVEHFDAPGAIYNFGPSYVHLISLDGFTSRFEPVAPYFWDEAANKRRMLVTISPATSEAEFQAFEPSIVGPNCSCTIPTPIATDPRQPQPPFLQELLSAWVNRPLPLTSSHGNGITTDCREARDLMRDLHRAACRNVIEGGGPFAAAIVSPQGQVVSFGANRVVAEQDAIAHGEVCAMREARRVLLQNSQVAQHPETALAGFSVVTSSITCISCAEQLARYGIKRLYYDNTKEDIEHNTPFTEGPLRKDFWERTGILVERIATDDALRFEAFRLFSAGLAEGRVISYLKDKAR